jgi:aminopeptidase N
MRLFFILLLVIFTNCTAHKQDNASMQNFNFTTVADPHSFSKPNNARIEHLSLDLNVDFENQKLYGLARIRIADHSETKLFLDTKNLVIERILIDDKLTVFKLHDEDSVKGKKLEISIGKGDKFITVYYSTKPNSPALQWLNRQQTNGKAKPMLFTQSQFILARSWMPCQDSPGLRFTFDAKITVPKGYLALMSAQNPTQLSVDGVYYFRQEKPIPAYLMSLAVGEFVFRPTGSKTGVYAEPISIEKVANEFADMAKMVASAEKIFGPYQWGRFDVLVLPASFPFGGMENPVLTYASPTVVVGDKSLISLVAHELAHSWSGNWVTNATWEDFWLNEGFTVYLEYRIMEEIYGKDYADILANISRKELEELISQMSDNQIQDTKLKLSLEGRDPVDGMTSIAYDKGYFLLKKIEQTVGRQAWDEFLTAYFKDFALKSITTEEFIFYMEQNLKNWKDFGIDNWIYGTGLPDDCPLIESTKVEEAKSFAALFAKGELFAAQIPKNWGYAQWVIFLSSLPKPLKVSQLNEIDKVFSLSQTQNCEIALEWFKHCLVSHYEPSYKAVSELLSSIGRKKIVYPLYKLMAQDPELKVMGYQIYKIARPTYHYITFSSVDPLFSEFEVWK